MYQNAGQAQREFEYAIKTYSRGQIAGFPAGRSYHIPKSEYTLESIVSSAQDYVIDLDRKPELIRSFEGKKYEGSASEEKGYESRKPDDSYKARGSRSYVFSPDIFLAEDRPPSAFVKNFSEIKDIAEQAFLALTGKEFPRDIIVNVCSWEELVKEYPQFADEGKNSVLGFAINRKHLSLPSIIFVKKDSLDRLLLTLGHEIGHVMTGQLPLKLDEEAKAFAFSIAWAETIRKENIGNLSKSIKTTVAPAENGLHDKALMFVLDKIKCGISAIEAFNEISSEKLSAELSL